MRSPRIPWTLLVLLLFAAGCTRGPDEAGLRADLQARLDAQFGGPVLVVKDLRRQGSAPFGRAGDGTAQAIVYFNASLQLAEAYDPSDWQGLSPRLIATTLGATDEGVVGLKAGRMAPGAVLRAHGSLVYRRDGDSWRAVDIAVPAQAPGITVPPAGRKRADELIQRLAQLVDTSPGLDRPERQQIVAEELDRALQNIELRLDRVDERPVVATGPADGEYARFVRSLTARLPSGQGVEVAHTEGSVENAFMIERGAARFGLLQSDVAAAAVTGGGVFATTGPMRNLRAVATLFPEPLHVLVRADAGVDSLSDLAGMRVMPGLAGSGTRFTALAVLAAHGLEPGAYVEVQAGSPAEALAMLGAGQLDALLVVASAPWEPLQRLVPGGGVGILALDPEAIGRIATTQRGLMAMEIQARTYPGQPTAITTVGATALLVAARDVPDDVVADVLELLFGAGASEGRGVAAARLSREQAQAGVTLPLHDAAARYFAGGAAP